MDDRGAWLPPPPAAPDPLVSLQAAALGGEPEVPALRDVTVALRPGMRLLLLGANGSGKSTLLHGLSGRLRPQAGRRTVGRFVQMLLWDQSFRDDAQDEEENPIQFVQRLAGGGADDDAALDVLTSIGLDQWAARRPCCCLSSGERTLVALAALALAPKNLLLLDDPTNFLGAAAAEVVADALSPERWDGTIVLASPNRKFCEALRPTHVAHLRGGQVRLFERPPCDADWSIDWSQDVEPEEGEAASSASRVAAGTAAANGTISADGEQQDHANQPSRGGGACSASEDSPSPAADADTIITGEAATVGDAMGTTEQRHAKRQRS